jgi:alkylhydroperoxidase/carboxymuconolactone decarboxylase family protein YurZ
MELERAGRGELVEMISHLGSYAGWPAAGAAIGIARKVFSKTGE